MRTMAAADNQEIDSFVKELVTGHCPSSDRRPPLPAKAAVIDRFYWFFINSIRDSVATTTYILFMRITYISRI